MIIINAFRDAVQVKLAAKFPLVRIYGEEFAEELGQGFKRPAFYVQVLPGETENENAAHRQKQILIILHYFVKDDIRRDLQAMGDDLEKLFNGVLVVSDRKLTIDKISPAIIDGVLQFQMNLDYRDSLDDVDVYGYEVPIKGTSLYLKQNVEEN